METKKQSQPAWLIKAKAIFYELRRAWYGEAYDESVYRDFFDHFREALDAYIAQHELDREAIYGMLREGWKQSPLGVPRYARIAWALRNLKGKAEAFGRCVWVVQAVTAYITISLLRECGWRARGDKAKGMELGRPGVSLLDLSKYLTERESAPFVGK